jgi:hypothetical protein
MASMLLSESKDSFSFLCLCETILTTGDFYFACYFALRMFDRQHSGIIFAELISYQQPRSRDLSVSTSRKSMVH